MGRKGTLFGECPAQAALKSAPGITSGAYAVEELSFTLQSGETIPCEIRRSARARKLRLGFSPLGQLSLGAPQAATLACIKREATQFLPWLEKNWPRFRERRFPDLPRSIHFPAQGQVWPVTYCEKLGESRLASRGAPFARVFNRGATRIALLEKDGGLAIFGPAADRHLPFAALACWCRAKAGKFLPQFLLALAEGAGLGVGRVLIGDQRSLWGSCSAQGAGGAPSIRLNWRAMLLADELLAHLCWHELCHIDVPGHSARFHRLLETRSPGSAALERALGRAWNELPGWVHAART